MNILAHDLDDPAYEDALFHLEKISKIMEGAGQGKPTIEQFFQFIEIIFKYSSKEIFLDLPPSAIESLRVKVRKIKNYKPSSGEVFFVPLPESRDGWFLVYAGSEKAYGDFFYPIPKQLASTSSPDVVKEAWEFCILADLDMIQEGKWIRRDDLDCAPDKFIPKYYYNKFLYPNDDSVSKYGEVEEFPAGVEHSRPLTKAECDRLGFNNSGRQLTSSSEDIVETLVDFFGADK